VPRFGGVFDRPSALGREHRLPGWGAWIRSHHPRLCKHLKIQRISHRLRRV